MIESVILLLSVFFSGWGHEFFRSREALIGFFVIVFIFNLRNRHKYTNHLSLIMVIWFIYFVLTTIKYFRVFPYFGFMYPAMIFIANYLVLTNGKELFKKVERIFFTLVVISLFFWSWQYLAPSSLFSLMGKLNTSSYGGGVRVGPDIYSTIFIYTVNNYDEYPEIPRNAGFCWEPGPFSIYIVLGMMFNLMQGGFNPFRTKRFWIYLAALLTTQSTTGVLMFLVLLVWYVYNNPFRNKNLYFVVFSPIVLLVGLYVFTNTQFLQKKIENTFYETQDTENMLRDAAVTGKAFAPQRFVSFAITWIDFVENPFLGYAGNYMARWTEKYGATVYAVTGLGNIMARFGLFGLISMTMLMYLSSKRMAFDFNFRGYWFLIFIHLIGAFSFGVIETPLYYSFLFYPLLRNGSKELNLRNLTTSK